MEYARCNLCNADDYSLVYICPDFPEFKIVKCNSCGLVYLNPRPYKKEIMSYYPPDYYTFHKPQGRKGLKHRLKVLVRETRPGYDRYNLWLKNLIGKVLFIILGNQINIIIPYIEKGKILDVGCGNGEMIAWMNRFGWKTYGVEVSPQAITLSKSSGIEVFAGDLLDAHYPDEFFDVVTINHVLEHVHNPLEMLKECHRVLKPDGLLIIDCPNFDYFDRKLFKQYWNAIQVPQHLYHFSNEQLTHLCKNADFIIKKRKLKLPFPLFNRGSYKIMRRFANTNFKLFLNLYISSYILKPILYLISFFLYRRRINFSCNLILYVKKE